MNKFKLAYGTGVILLAGSARWRRERGARGGGASPVATYVTIVTGPLQDLFGITEVLVRAVPLILVALGIAISFRSGIINIGAEGQMLMGILAATATALALPGLPKIVLLPWSCWRAPSAAASGAASPACSGPSSGSTRSSAR